MDTADQALSKFVQNLEKLYGATNVYFNVHLLMHLAASVHNWGPLWATSTFIFKSFNGTLLRFSTQGLSKKKSGTKMANVKYNKRKLCDKLQSRSG